MTCPGLDITALVGSRICHDLISPLGAIGNGVELLQMVGDAVPSPELRLIADSVETANARIRLFRVAFGRADPGQMVTQAEMRAILNGMFSGRINCDWRPETLPRAQAKFALLVLLCLETALPYGGEITVHLDDGAMRIEGMADRLILDEPLWSGITTHGGYDSLKPAQVQFALLAEMIRDSGRRLTITLAETSICLEG